MNVKSNEQGLGVVAAIVLVAVLGIGGTVAYQTYVKGNVAVEVDEKEMVDEAERDLNKAKVDAETSLTKLSADIKSGVNTNVNATLAALANIEAGLRDAYTKAGATAEGEFQDIEASFDKIEAEVKAGSNTAADSIGNLMTNVSVEAETVVEAMMDDAEDMVDDHDADDHTHDDGEDHSGDMDADVSVEGNMDTSAEMDDEAVDGEAGIDTTTDLRMEL